MKIKKFDSSKILSLAESIFEAFQQHKDKRLVRIHAMVVSIRFFTDYKFKKEPEELKDLLESYNELFNSKIEYIKFFKSKELCVWDYFVSKNNGLNIFNEIIRNFEEFVKQEKENSAELEKNELLLEIQETLGKINPELVGKQIIKAEELLKEVEENKVLKNISKLNNSNKEVKNKDEKNK